MGKAVAILEAKTLCAMMLRRFQFALVKGHKVLYRFSVTLPMRNGLLMTVRKR